MTWWQFVIWTAIVLIPSFISQVYLYMQLRRIRRLPPIPAWSELQRVLVGTLHKPHPESKELDLLLEKLETFAVTSVSMISDADTDRLMELLKEKTNDATLSEDERVRADFLLVAIPRAKKERESKG